MMTRAMKPETIARRAAERIADRKRKIELFRANYRAAQLQYGFRTEELGEDQVFCYVPCSDGEEISINSNGFRKW